MIKEVGTVTIFVKDQQRAKQFYTETLGFDLRTEAPMFPGAPTLWIEVVPPGAQTSVVLYQMDQHWQHYENVLGKSQAVTFNVEDLRGTVAELRAKGVEIVTEPSDEDWGSSSFIKDSEGNSLLLVQLPQR